MKSIGVGIGATRLKMVVISSSAEIVHVRCEDHQGNPKTMLFDWLRNIDPREIDGFAATGREGVSFISVRNVLESQAIGEAIKVLDIEADAVVSFGGESFVVYPIGHEGEVLDHITGNRCAAGTVAFFRQQLDRMGLRLDETELFAREGKIISLSRRCSVHCKSDCTHALNRKFCTVGDIVRTLCHDMAEKIAGLVHLAGITGGHLMAVGGATANKILIEELKQIMPNFTVEVPEQAPWFEAYGAALLARQTPLPPVRDWTELARAGSLSFRRLAPLHSHNHRVVCLSSRCEQAVTDAKYVLGIDGGSTTTKAVLVNVETRAICANSYTRTRGNPDAALRQCLREILEQIDGTSQGLRNDTGIAGAMPRIVGIATTGSSGEILSVLCRTPWYHNEIIAHACGATHFVPDVDTIVEIGGQDAKFTTLQNGVPVDFAMNESCAAGTGSFIEETAKNDLGVEMGDIASLALAAGHPLQFSDQCTAFANSDVRKAFLEGASREDNLAGLVYAMVENYLNKVVGKRSIGNKVLFQGGTSRNMAVAHALALRIGKDITVPPHSELMGCFGIALWLCGKLASGEAEERDCRIDKLVGGSSRVKAEFRCRACENLCMIQQFEVEGELFPFGGRCNRWTRARQKRDDLREGVEGVARRNNMLFQEFGIPPLKTGQRADRVIGMQSVFTICNLYPLYSHYFAGLGYAVRLSGKIDAGGVRHCQSAQCHPCEIAHGTFEDLVAAGVKDIFVPHVVAGASASGEHTPGLSCPVEQAIPYILSSAFAGNRAHIHRPVLKMGHGLEEAEPAFVKMAHELGADEHAGRIAFRKGCEKQREFWSASRKEGCAVLEALDRTGGIGIVMVGRPYNALSPLANMELPRKFASHGVTVVPYDFLPCEREPCDDTMQWRHGEEIIKAMQFIQKRENLFAVYVSNFGCGPDAFLQHFAADIMDGKPWLFLELDSHTSDAGVMTRVSAFLDIAEAYRKTDRKTPTLQATASPSSSFAPAEVCSGDHRLYVRTSSGETVPFTDPRVLLAYPCMGRYNAEAMVGVTRQCGVRSIMLPASTSQLLAVGREFTSGKECVPTALTMGALMNFCRHEFKRVRKDEILVFFMPTEMGPCRFSQYNVFMKNTARALCIRDLAFFSPNAATGYMELGPDFVRSAWQAVVIAGLMYDVRALLKVAAPDKDRALAVLDDQWQKLCKAFERGRQATWETLESVAQELAGIKLQVKPQAVPKVLLAGEIYVRFDDLCCGAMEDYYAKQGIMMKRPDVTEWLLYTDWLNLHRAASGMQGSGQAVSDMRSLSFLFRHWGKGMLSGDATAMAFARVRFKMWYETLIEQKARRILQRSGLLVTRQHGIDELVRHGAALLDPALEGEAILTIGTSLQLLDPSSDENYCGVVLVGPFNCMPSGVAESILKPHLRRKGIPFLMFQTDGNPIPSNLRSQMEVHAHRVSHVAETRQGRHT